MRNLDKIRFFLVDCYIIFTSGISVFPITLSGLKQACVSLFRATCKQYFRAVVRLVKEPHVSRMSLILLYSEVLVIQSKKQKLSKPDDLSCGLITAPLRNN